MKPSINKIHKIFKLEASRGYDNRAVVGGLNRILDTWEAEARSDAISEDLIEAIRVRLRDYPNLSEKSRAEALEGLWTRLQNASEIPETNHLVSKPKAQTPSPPPKPKPAEHAEQIEEESTASSGGLQTDQVSSSEVEKPAAETKKEEEPAEPPAALDAPVTVIKNIGPRNANTLARLNIHTLRDLLYNFPRRYDDYSLLKPINRLRFDDVVTVIGTVTNVSTRMLRGKNQKFVEAVIDDKTGSMRATWFNPWESKRLRSGMQIALSGKVEQYLGRLVLNNPEWEPIDQQMLNTNRIVPVYPLTGKITQRWLRKVMNEVVTHWAGRVEDHLPKGIRQSANLVDLQTAIQQIHYPDSWDKLKQARDRLAFDEIFLLQLGVQKQKVEWKQRSGQVFDTPNDWLVREFQKLPYQLTDAQCRAIDDIRNDFISGHPMNRLLQGDVGSGKTVIAALGAAMVIRHGSQVALMAPTSILAEQHYQNLRQLLDDANEPGNHQQIRLMIGATPASEKNEIRAGLTDGTIKFVIGTHALIEDPVQFADLQFTIVDEQHRFGVEQRSALRSKGTNPHLLVMTATPIPRSLALTVYGDLDLTVMDEMPPGRQEVGTYVLTPLERERAYRLIQSQVENGQQAFIIYPLVEESESSEARAAVEEHNRLQQEIFPHNSIGLMHGRLRPEEKDAVMAKFHNQELDILVSTSVVEVGVDVPNATVMLIEGANRFGLAQLHQFRGRVGRGAEKSYCILIPESSEKLENERLKVMAQTTDGFVLAEHDLEQRGPGEFLGTRQSGYTELKIASLSDVQLIEKARRQAHSLHLSDPELIRPENQRLAAALLQFWGESGGDIS